MQTTGKKPTAVSKATRAAKAEDVKHSKRSLAAARKSEADTAVKGTSRVFKAIVKPRKPPPMELQSTLTCPECGHSAIEIMPTNACQFFYDCKACGIRLRPKSGDCCVFCSYGSVPCPPVQTTESAVPETGSETCQLLANLPQGLVGPKKGRMQYPSLRWRAIPSTVYGSPHFHFLAAGARVSPRQSLL
jgi:hypothetical protein